jgi:NADH:ubiquinone reductase (H+-translocating)
VQERSGTETPARHHPARHHVVIVGAGFGGLFAVRALRRSPVEVTIVDRTNHHLFQPLLYQVATGVLSEGDIAPPTREVLRRFENTKVVLGEVADVNLERRELAVHTVAGAVTIEYDSLIVAAGAGQSYFGHDEFALYAPGMKTVDDALELRGRIFGALEMAELERDDEARRAWLTFAVIGAGPTGVELAGQISELSRRALKHNFRAFDPTEVRVVLIDALDKVLASFPPQLQRRALKDLEKMGVEIRLNTRVTKVDVDGIEATGPDGGTSRIEARAKVWAAGVEASSLGAILAKQSGAELDHVGRISVLADCTLPGHPEVFVVGDLMSLNDLPGVAEVAMQSGHHAAKTISKRLKGRTDPKPFRYVDLGTMAAISRFRAVVSFGRVHVGGFVGWLMWLGVHLAFLTGHRNRIAAVANWGLSFVGHSRRQRTITEQEVFARVRRLHDAGAVPG